MNVLMGHNMMRKDGDEHMAERHAIFPRIVRDGLLRQSGMPGFADQLDEADVRAIQAWILERARESAAASRAGATNGPSG